jgi:preprotein translocase subunit SecF
MIAASILAVGLWQFRYGIDFVGGTLWEVAIPQEQQVTNQEIINLLEQFGIEGAVVTFGDDGRILTMRFLEITPETHQEIYTALTEKIPGTEELRFETVGPTISATLRQKAMQAILLALAAIALYVTWAFRQVSRPVASWKYGAITLATLFHDVMITVGLFAFLGRFAGVEIGSQFVVALLVVMGFSVHDTIVVFDRIRENIKKAENNAEFSDIVEKSIRETIVRSINTFLTLMAVLVALWIWGPETLRWFSFALLAGTAIGTYSSIFLASPLLVDLAIRRNRAAK